MPQRPVGISDISVYVPQPQIDIATIIRERAGRRPELERHLRRATETTGQRVLRFPEPWEDTTTMAAQATRLLIDQCPDLDIGRVRYLAVGTETPIDQSKAVAAYVEGMLQRSGVPIPRTISTFQVQHACAGGALAAISVLALLALSNRSDEAGLIACSDVARYREETTAEVTQGAGAAAIFVENDPKLVELDLDTMGFSSEDVDDFFRPLGCTVASVKGMYSIQCYNSSLERAFLDHCERRGLSPAETIRSTDYFVLHTPFRNMPLRAMVRLIESCIGQGKEEAELFLRDHALYQAVDPIARVGNTYTASLFMSLAFLLDEQFRRIGDRIVGKRILLASYGSGNTMAVLSATVSESAPSVLARWDTERVWSSARDADMFAYEKWLATSHDRAHHSELVDLPENIPRGRYYLSGIREDGYREYRYNEK